MASVRKPENRGVKTNRRTQLSVTKAERTVAIRQKQDSALRLRMSGITLAAIAEQLGYANASGAQKAINAAMERIGREPAAHLLEMELARLDQMQAIAWRTMLQENDTSQINNILRIMDKRHRLTGLEHHAATQINVVNVNGKEVHMANNGVMLIEGDEESYIQMLAATAGLKPEEVALLRPNNGEEGRPQITSGDEDVSGKQDSEFGIIDAEIVEDESTETSTESETAQ